MTKTEYLFGYPKEKYIGMPFPQIGYSRINDAEILLDKLRAQATKEPIVLNKEHEELVERVHQVYDAISTWKKILEIEKD